MYYSGVANSWADLRTAIFNACTANGWALTDDVLSKGAAYVRLITSTATSGAPGPGVIAQGGTGYSGGTLVNASPIRPRMGRPNYGVAEPTMPVEYYIHLFTGPDEVYVIAKADVDFYYFLAFGVSTISLPGSGLWISASASYQPGTSSSSGIYISPTIGGSANSGSASGGFLWETSGSSNADYLQDTIRASIDAIDWLPTIGTGSSLVSRFNGVRAAAPMVEYSPNAWNSASPLIRIRGLMVRASSKSSLVCDIQNARYLRVDNFAPGEIITLGSDQWRVYPFYRKDATDRDAGGNSIRNHSGTMGWAIKYDGP